MAPTRSRRDLAGKLLAWALRRRVECRRGRRRSAGLARRVGGPYVLRTLRARLLLVRLGLGPRALLGRLGLGLRDLLLRLVLLQEALRAYAARVRMFGGLIDDLPAEAKTG